MIFATTAVVLAILHSTLAADSSKTSHKPCTLRSPATGLNFDITTIQLHPPTKASSKDARTESWHSRGYDYGSNFTLNFCGPVIEDLDDVVGVPESRVANVSAFYKQDGKTYSIGQESAEPIFRGRKLVLNYTNGSPCPDTSSSMLDSRKLIDDDDDEKKKLSKGDEKKTKSGGRRKSTILSFLCDRDPQYNSHPQISFIGTPDSCTYIFEVRSRAACGGAASSSPSTLGPGGVFGVIFGIAICVYFIGGCAYQRTVMHQRGWRQCPNHAAWKGIGDFFGDMFVIFTSKLGLPSFSFNRAFNTGGYHRVGTDDFSSRSGGGRGRAGNGSAANGNSGSGNGNDESNRLIDQLDEEWED